ncbi:MAG: AAA family ATPase [Proteobacteria bacterium]|nr:AAA family ATPase [Pseudomonadota bacterium]
MNDSSKRQKVPIGISDFKKVRENGYYFVDKTCFIQEVLESASEILLLPRPRRFGKTLNLSMLRYFFEKTEKGNRGLFKGLAIDRTDFFEEHQGKYPVVYLTFKDIKGNTWDNVYRGIVRLIVNEIERHSVVLKSDAVSRPDKQLLTRAWEGIGDQRDYEESLTVLSRSLEAHYRQRVVILMDEYDTPIQAGYDKGFYDEIIAFMRNFLSGGLKDNVHLFKGVITGILRVAKESIFSGLNNLKVHTLLSERFNTAFGFTEAEVGRLLAAYDMMDRFEMVSRWYNGYNYSSEVIFNPWSVLNFVDEADSDGQPYWVNTGSTEIIEKLATRGGRELRGEIGALIEGGTITKSIHDDIVMRDLDRFENLIWSFLLFSGYLTVVEKVEGRKYRLRIPNQELREVYSSLIINWFEEKTAANQLEEMLDALQAGNMESFECHLKRIVEQIMSYHDLGDEPEKVYHALVLGMLVWLSGAYEIRSNREFGLGRFDIMLKPKDPDKQGIVVEFKRTGGERSHEETLRETMKQIEEKKYVAELQASGVKSALNIAVAFEGKRLWLLWKTVDC